MPFTTEQFLNVFKDYNTSVFPMQIFLNLTACMIIALLFLKNEIRNKIISAALCFLWLWIGVVYHIIFFTEINSAAYGFGALFIIQSLTFLYWGVIRNDLQFTYREDWIGIIGWFMIIYSLLIYPVLGYIFGHAYPKQPTFGLPCPTTIFTFGVFLFLSPKTKIFFYIIPVLWSLLGFSAVFKMSIYEDTGLIIAAALSIGLFLFQRKSRPAVVKNA